MDQNKALDGRKHTNKLENVMRWRREVLLALAHRFDRVAERGFSLSRRAVRFPEANALPTYFATVPEKTSPSQLRALLFTGCSA